MNDEGAFLARTTRAIRGVATVGWDNGYWCFCDAPPRAGWRGLHEPKCDRMQATLYDLEATRFYRDRDQ